MKQQLQEFDFDKSPYERPGQKWVCGWAAKGQPCRISPDPKGRCRATYECTPIQRGDRWYCARPSSSGGNCEAGPLPDGTCCNPIPRCQPVRSIRVKRGIVTRVVFAFTFGMILLLLGGTNLEDWRHAFILPGLLTAQHAVLDCASCHIAAEEGKEPTRWLYDAVMMSGAGIDSQQCLKCHSTLGEHAMKVHGRPLEEMTQITERIKQKQTKRKTPLLLSLVALGPGVPQNENGELICATCHHEHKGQDADLAEMDDRRCQTCHTNKFASFVNGHPEFSNYPYQRRTRIIFNHNSHTGYFGQKDREFACLDCHTPAADGQQILSSSFEETCASCHAEQIEAGQKDVEFLTLPVLHIEELNARELPIGQWPADADSDEEYEGALTPFMVLLMSGDPEYPNFAEDLEICSDLGLFDELGLFDLSDADDEELMAVERIAWGVKRLLHDLATRGHEALRERLEKGVGPPLDRREWVALTGQLSVDSVRAAQQKWMPKLMDEVVNRAGGRKGVVSDDEDDLFEAEDDDTKELVSAGGWYRQDLDSLSLRYRPTGHADAFLQGWLNLTGRFYGTDYAAEIFTNLSDSQAPGLCTKCHSIDALVTEVVAAEGNQSRRINWFAARPAPNVHKFTYFVHAPHLVKGCQTCHSTKTDFNNREFKTVFEKTDPTVFVSNFELIAKETCAECHTAKKAKSNCLNCHNYHIGEFAMARYESH
ncbi:MAG: hypothetical protein O7E52_03700 [Candidatus Poribacteria bacterium]|nr:hypothetical protein [Candidatus Poribacteria bacterium]